MALPARPSRRALAAAAAVALAGCAGIDLNVNRRTPGTIADGRFAPGRPPAARFGADPARTCPAGEPMSILADEMVQLGAENHRAPALPDGRLCQIAEALLAWDAAGPPPRPGVVAFAAAASGLPTQVAPPVITDLETEDGKLIADRVGETIGRFAARVQQPRFGVATQRVRHGVTKLVLVLADLPVDLQPVPRRLALGETAVIAGTFLGDVKNPAVYVSDVMGHLSEPPVLPGAAFRAEVTCGPRPGRIQVEIRGEVDGRPAVLESFPIACATDLPASVPVVDPDVWPADPAGQARRLAAVANAERAAVGLPPLAWDEQLAAVAGSVSEALRDEAKAGAARSAVKVGERLLAVGIASTVVLQNPAEGRNVEAVSERFLSSPGHRANLMSPEVNTFGAGVVPVPLADGTPGVIVTELLIKELPPIDVEKVRGQLRAAVAAKRRAARAAPLADDPALDELAEGYATAMAAAHGAPPKAVSDALDAALRHGFRAVNVISGARSDPMDFAEEPSVIGGGTVLGVGVAQGMHPVLGRHGIYVVVLVGQRR